MSKSYLVLALLMAAVVALHVFGGGPEYAAPFKAALTDQKLVAMSQVLWHMVSASLATLTAAYLWMAYRPCRPLAVLSSGLQLLWAGLFLGYGLAWLGEAVTMPQWVLFVLFPAATLLIERRRGTKG